MKKREFDKILNSCCDKKKLSLLKISQLADDIKDRMIMFLVRKRMPILKELLSANTDMAWLHCCGYLYTTAGAQFTFLHTCEHTIR